MRRGWHLVHNGSKSSDRPKGKDAFEETRNVENREIVIRLYRSRSRANPCFLHFL
ncbi:hypothetical protein CKA32_001782 [Geitlerinema sp. FC II]|nr:hypothetical protein CKA32_001782 [Geitlerinema sp. FC II]